MAIKVADEDQFNQVAEKLRGMGYYADGRPQFGTWEHKIAREDVHVLTYKDGEFALHSHEGDFDRTRYTYEQFMQL